MNPITALFGLIGSLLNGIGDSIGYLTGKVNKNRKSLAKTSELIDTKFDNISKTRAANQDKILESIRDLEISKSKLERILNKEHENLNHQQKKQDGALVLAKNRVAALGNDPEKAKTDAEYQECMKAWQEAADAKKAIQILIDDNKSAIEEIKSQIKLQEGELDDIARKNRELDIQKNRLKANAQIADIMDNRTRVENGLPSTNKEEQEMQDLGEELQTRIKTATRRQDAGKADDKFIAAASTNSDNAEFEALMGFKSPNAPVAEPARLPEA